MRRTREYLFDYMLRVSERTSASALLDYLGRTAEWSAT
jgi:hypothetical protein